MSSSSLMSARTVGHAITDPNLRFPKKPRVMSSLQMVPHEKTLLFHGSENLQILSGNAATSFLPKLLPLLNGENSVEDIIDKFDQYAPQDIINVLSLLFMRGVIDDAEGDQNVDLEYFKPNVLDFFERNNDSTRVNKSAAYGLKRLKDVKLVILTDSNRGNILLEEIRYMGAQDINLQNLADDFKIDHSTLVVVFCSNALDHERLDELDQICRNKGIPWLLTRVDANQGIVGPYFEEFETPKYEIYRKEIKFEDEKDSNPKEELIDMWEYFSAIEIVYFITKLAPSVTGVEYLSFNFDDWTSTSKRLYSLSEADLDYTALKFENAVAFPSQHLITPKSHQVHYNPKNLLLSSEGKNYPSAELIKIQMEVDNSSLQGDFLANSNSISSIKNKLDLKSLTKILTMSGGLKKSGELKRWAPTGGNLGSPQFYIMPTNVEGLEPNLLFYQYLDESLAKIGKVSGKRKLIEQIIDITGVTNQNIPDALIIITGNYERTSSKYNGFAYKVIHLDGGVALSQMQAIVKGMQLDMKIFQTWNEQLLIDYLGIDPYKEPIVAIAGIFGKGAVE